MTPAPLLVIRFEPASANSVGCRHVVFVRKLQCYIMMFDPLTLIWRMVFHTCSEFLSKLCFCSSPLCILSHIYRLTNSISFGAKQCLLL
jgi:hypothetical protein